MVCPALFGGRWLASRWRSGLQELLGYTMGSYALGYYSDPDADSRYVGILPPEVALGRLPKEGFATIDND